MKRDNLDFIDVKILNKLQENGRTTNVELAEFVDLSAPPCLRRVKALEKRGYIAIFKFQCSAPSSYIDIYVGFGGFYVD